MEQPERSSLSDMCDHDSSRNGSAMEPELRRARCRPTLDESVEKHVHFFALELYRIIKEWIQQHADARSNISKKD